MPNWGEIAMIQHSCPDCGQVLRSADHLTGMSIFCFKCSASVTVPSSGTSDTPPGMISAKWRTVHSGLRLVRNGTCCFLFAFTMAFVPVLTNAFFAPSANEQFEAVRMQLGNPAQRAPEPTLPQKFGNVLRELLPLANFSIGLGLLIGTVLLFVGEIMCCLGPKPVVALGGWAFAGFIVSAGALLVGPVVGWHFLSLCFLLYAGGFFIGPIVFAVFLRGVARFFDERELVKSANSYLIFEGVLASLCLLLLAFMKAGERPNGTLLSAFGSKVVASICFASVESGKTLRSG
jgi:hypothetical protein